MTNDELYELLKSSLEQFGSQGDRFKYWVSQMAAGSSEAGAANYRMALDYSTEVGNAAVKILERYAGEIMTAEDAYEAIFRYLTDVNANVGNYARLIQEDLNKKAGIGIKAQEAEINRSDASMIAHDINHAKTAEEMKTAVEKVKKFADSAADNTLKKNISFQGRSGLHPKVVRTAEAKACAWCRGLAGSYEYPVPGEVFQRHDNCKCMLMYDGRYLRAIDHRFGE